jgi:NAD(P)-dependent dehydrogenase (short-subunit alcohol dehydrogenase family)
MGIEAFRFDGKYAVVVGGATGMGRATSELVSELGAEVVVMDFAEVTQADIRSIKVDLRDRGSINTAIDALDRHVDALFSCAGVAEGTPSLELVNFVGQRHMMERMVDEGRMAPSSAISVISSLAALGWEKRLGSIQPLLDTSDFAAAASWFAAHPEYITYRFSKRAMSAYVAQQAFSFLAKGVRINAIMPGPTDTPFTQVNPELYFGFGKEYREATGTEPSVPTDQAYPLVFLCSPGAGHVTGITIPIDNGCSASALAGSFSTPALDQMMDRD